jgi:hypothetical protein
MHSTNELARACTSLSKLAQDCASSCRLERLTDLHYSFLSSVATAAYSQSHFITLTTDDNSE